MKKLANHSLLFFILLNFHAFPAFICAQNLQPNSYWIYNVHYEESPGGYTDDTQRKVTLEEINVTPSQLGFGTVPVPSVTSSRFSADLDYGGAQPYRNFGGSPGYMSSEDMFESSADGTLQYILYQGDIGAPTYFPLDIESGLTTYSLLTGSNIGRPYVVGNSWQSSMQRQMYMNSGLVSDCLFARTTTVTAAGVSVTVPGLGTFEDCFEIVTSTDSPPSCTPESHTDYWSPTVMGVVKRIDNKYVGVDTWELASYSLVLNEAWVDDAYTSGGANDGHTWGVDAFDSIQGGIDAVSSPGVVHVAAGTYYENITMKSGVEILGAGKDVATIDGGAAGTVVTAVGVDAAAKIDGFTITNGSNFYAGGMHNDNSSPIVSNCVFKDNSNCGMYNDNSSPTVSDCQFSGNAHSAGAGMYNANSSTIVTNCCFLNNTASLFGGGMANSQCSPTITNCIFTGNDGGSTGGGMYSDGASATVSLINCTFSGNTADEGGGLYLYDGLPEITNCIFWGNIATSSENEIYNNAATPIVSYSNIQGGYPGTGNIGDDPLAHDPKFRDSYHLRSDSPCIDAGDDTAVPGGVTTDIDGAPRFIGTVDMGADENNGVIIYVDADATAGADNGTSWTNAYLDLQDALADADSGDEILVAEGTYYPGTTRSDSFAMINNVAIYGGFDPTSLVDTFEERDWITYETILSGDVGETPGEDTDNSYHVFYHDTSLELISNAVLDGFTITGGYANGSYPSNSGSGMFNNSCSPTLNNCKFMDNYALFDGAGMYNVTSSSPMVINCTFSENTADRRGGAICNYNTSSPEITNCSFQDNDAIQDGGSLFNANSSSPTLTSCTISGNTANNYGGGMYNAALSSPTLINCLFVGNQAISNGGGMFNNGSSPTLTNCTFYGNSSPTAAGMRNYASNPIITNCIFWGDSPYEILDNSSSPIVTFCNIQGGYSGSGNINSPPLFVDPDGADDIAGNADDDFRLQWASPCIDAGDNSAVPVEITADMDGVTRFFDDPDTADTGSGTPPLVDMGSYEFIDTDGDGIPDYTETSGCMDPGDVDSDGDGIEDGIEDTNHDAVVDPGESDPCDADTDDDGIIDGMEDANQDGIVDAGETDPLDADTDDDGIQDGTELGYATGHPTDTAGTFVPDADGGSTTTDPLDDDTDDDGISDGVEDANQNGMVDGEETDPLVQTTVAGLPFTEYFTDTPFRDDGKTNAQWSTDEQKVHLAWKKAIYGVMSDPVTWDVGVETDNTQAIGLGDVDGDGDLDVVVGNDGETNKLYLNNGTIVPFLTSSAVNISTDTDSTQAIALGDMDGDGDLDVVAGNLGQTNKLYLNNGDNTFAPGTSISADTDLTLAITLGDVDDDGDIDAIAGNGWPISGSGERNKLYLNDGVGDPFDNTTVTYIGEDAEATQAVALGDMDGDGHLDVVIGNFMIPPMGHIKLYLNDGIDDPYDMATGENLVSETFFAPTAIALGDVDGDGDLDVVVGVMNKTDKLYLNNGTLSPFSGVESTDIGTVAESTDSIELCDVDGDGDLDVMAGIFNKTNKLYLNDGVGDPFDTAVATDVGMEITPRILIPGDMDGDGDLDVVVGNEEGQNKVYLNNGSSSPFNGVVGTDIGTDADTALSMELGDVDGDGNLDVVTENRLYLNNGSESPFEGISGTIIASDSSYIASIAIGDVDGDGNLDLVSGNGGFGEANKLYLNNGTSLPFDGTGGTNIDSDTDTTASIKLGDMDGDGNLDVVAGNVGNYDYGQTNKLYLNNGTSLPFDGSGGTDIGSETDKTQDIELGDVDGDGNLDVVAVEYKYDEPSTIKGYLNNGTSTPFSGVNGTIIGVDTQRIDGLKLGDVDGDGDLDVVTRSEGSSTWTTTKLYLNNGTSDPFNMATVIPIGAGDAFCTHDMSLGDVDGDGDLDLVAGNRDRRDKLYLNDGIGDPFDTAVGYDITTEVRTEALSLGDVDGDGDLDIVAARSNYGEEKRLFLNNGMASLFSGRMAETQLGSEPNISKAIAIGDVDGDGDLDVVAGNDSSSQASKLYLNDGSLSPFNEMNITSIGTDMDYTWAITLGDVDKDGDLDVVTGNHSQPNKLYLNDGSETPFIGVASIEIGTDTDATKAVSLGDVDKDGDLDVVTGNYNQRNKVYLNDDSGTPFLGMSGLEIGTDEDATTAISVADINGDGTLDVVAGNDAQTNKLYLNNEASPLFSDLISGIAIGTDEDNTHAISLDDVDGDGDIDVVGGNDAQTNKLYLNNGASPLFSDLTSGMDIGTDVDNTSAILLSDVDGDGDFDVVVGNDGQTNRLYLNNRISPLFSDLTSGIDIGNDSDNTWAISVGDIDGNGDFDVVVGNNDQENILYRCIRYDTGQRITTSLEIDTEDINNISNATLSPTQTLEPNTWVNYFMSNNGGQQFFQVYPGVQFMFPTQGSDLRWRAELHSLSPALTPRIQKIEISNVSIPPEATAGGTLSYEEEDAATPIDDTIMLSDIDNPNFMSATVNISDGYASDQDVLGFTDTHATYAIALLDVNGDSYVDLVTGNSGETNKLFLNNGTADPFAGTVSANISLDADYTYSIALADLNNDTYVDMVAGNNGEINQLYLNNGTADPFSGVAGTDIGTDLDFTHAVALEDLNSDGDPDLVVGNDEEVNRVYLNNGTADPFDEVPGSDIGTDTNHTRAIALSDVDGDNDVDLVTGNNGETNRVYLNNGDGTFASGADIGADTHYTRAVALGDVNGDTHVDMVAGNWLQPTRLYLNNGTADPFNGVAGTDIGTDTDYTHSLTLKDVDDDTDLDLITGNNGQPNKVYLNNGTADPFSGVIGTVIGSETDYTRAIAMEDVDGDSDLDLVTGNESLTNKLYLNNGTADPFNGVVGTAITIGAYGITWSWDSVAGELTLTGSSSVSNYQAALRSITYINTDNINPTEGEREIRFVVNDGVNNSEAVTSTVNVSRKNDAPIITGQNTVTTEEETGRTILFSDLIVYDPDDSYPVGFWLQVWDDGDDDNYSVSGDTVTPDTDFIGTLMVPVQVSDGDWSSMQFYVSVEVTDNTPPVTTASIPGGAYNTNQDVNLNCSDDPPLGTGCAVTYYTDDETTPTEGPSDEYPGGDIEISTNTTLKFFSIDAQGNIETIKTEIYVIDKVAPDPDDLIIEYPVNGYAYKHMNIINGTASDPDSGIALVELQVSDGANYLNQNPLPPYLWEFTENPNWVTASGTTIWSFATNSVPWVDNKEYTITARATDAAGNSATTFVVFTFGEHETSITCELSASSITLGESITVSGCIKSDDDECITDLTSAPDLTVTIYPPSGPSTGITIDSITEGGFGKVISCEKLNMANIVGPPPEYTLETWTVQTSWAGDSFYSSATSDPVPLSVAKADTDMTLLIASSATIKANTEPPIGGKLTATPVCGAGDLSGLSVTLTITDPPDPPDNSDVIIATTNMNGQFDLDYDASGFVFDELGEWTIEASFSGSGDTNYNGASPVSINVEVVPTAGYAVIIEGMITSEEGLESHNKTAKLVYKSLTDRRLLEDDIEYLSWFPDTDGRDGWPFKTNVQASLTTAMNNMNTKAGDLYIVMLNHGWTQGDDGVFYLGSETITSTELDTWLTALQAGLNPTAANRKIIVILGFCRAGAFIEDVSGPNRIIIASAAADESSHRGPRDKEGDDEIREGEYFVSEFFNFITMGNSVIESFNEATALTELYTSSGSGEVNAPYFDDSAQHPVFDDNEDGIGSNVLSAVSGDDGYASNLLYIGANRAAANDPDDVYVTQICDPRFLETGEDSVDLLWVKLNDKDRMGLLWAEVKEPDYDPGTPVQYVQIEMDTYKDGTSLYNGTEERYEWDDLDGGSEKPDLFDNPGTYQVFYLVQDNLSNNTSQIVEGRVYKARPDVWGDFTTPNLPPEPIGTDTTFSLRSPENNEEVRTTVILSWDPLVDPEGDNFTYRVILSRDSECFDESELTCPHRMTIEDVKFSTCLAVLPEYEWDDSNIYWMVEAIDEYGAVQPSEMLMFKTDNDNPQVKVVIQGFVSDSATDKPVDDAILQFASDTLYTVPGGAFLGSVDEGTYAVSVDGTGFVQEVIPGVDINGGSTTPPILTFDMTTSSSTDTDGDGLSDYIEIYSSTYEVDFADADSDDDGIPDGDEDADQDGIWDADETDPSNADTDDDGIQDGTELGIETGVSDPDGAGPLLGTNTDDFQPDLDPYTVTDPLNDDTDGDGTIDGIEDSNHNGRVDTGETDPNPIATIPTLNEWGMIFFFILLIGSAFWVNRRKNRQGLM